jgi:hypothetical protein
MGTLGTGMGTRMVTPQMASFRMVTLATRVPHVTCARRTHTRAHIRPRPSCFYRNHSNHEVLSRFSRNHTRTHTRTQRTHE